jgi:hypothetical protein
MTTFVEPINTHTETMKSHKGNTQVPYLRSELPCYVDYTEMCNKYKGGEKREWGWKYKGEKNSECLVTPSVLDDPSSNLYSFVV